jgi:outer membrane protein assembly factor BamB
MRDVLVCLEATSGRELWRVDFVGALKTPVPDFGYVSSPLVEGEAIYTQAGAAVVKLNKRTGEILWRRLADEGGMWGSAFSSPLLATVKGRQQLIVQTRADLAGLDPESGDVLWSQPVEAFRGMNILTPVVYKDAVFTSSYGGRTILHAIEETEGARRVVPLWEQKIQGYMSTPVVVDGHAYLHLRNQRLVCLDLASGEEKWMHRGGFGKYWSLVANKTRLLGLDQRGRLYLVEATPDGYHQVDERVISDQETWAHLAVTDGHLFIRELRGISAWRWQAP